MEINYGIENLKFFHGVNQNHMEIFQISIFSIQKTRDWIWILTTKKCERLSLVCQSPILYSKSDLHRCKWPVWRTLEWPHHLVISNWLGTAIEKNNLMDINNMWIPSCLLLHNNFFYLWDIIYSGGRKVCTSPNNLITIIDFKKSVNADGWEVMDWLTDDDLQMGWLCKWGHLQVLSRGP